MIIGIDFDNTIADYTGVFYSVAMNLGWLPKEIGQSKEDVKAYFINAGNESKWTELQGIVYGKEINLAKPYPECLEVLQELKLQGHTLKLISHKTRYPIIGEKVNFHIAAKCWLSSNQFIQCTNAPFEAFHLYFKETKTLKLQTINELNCDIFIDDLYSVLSDPLFPSRTKKIHFTSNITASAIIKSNSWIEISKIISSMSL